MLAQFMNINSVFARLAPALAFATGGVAIVLAFAALAGASPYNWTPDSSWQTNGRVRTIVYSGGVIYLGGEFTQVRPPGTGGTPVARNHLAALDEATGQLLPWNPNADGIVWSLDVSGSTVYLGGEFQNVGGATRPYAAAVGTANGLATSWNPQPNGTVNVVKVGPDGNVYLGGSFTRVGVANRQLIGSITPGGGVRSWHPVVKQVTGSTCPPRCSPFVTSFAFSADGQNLYFGGHFGLVNTIGRNNAAEVDLATGTTTLPWNPDVFGQGLGKNPNQANKVWSIALGPSRAYICGDWWSVDGFQRHPNMAGVDLVDGHLDTSFVATTDGNTQSCVLSGGTLFLGGHFDNTGPNSAWVINPGTKSTLTGPGSAPRVHIAAVDAATGALDGWNPGINSTLGVHYMTTDGTHLAVGGDFTRFGGVDQEGFVQLSLDTTPPDTILDTGPALDTNSSDASFTFHSTEKANTFQCSLDGVPLSPCTSPASYTGLADGDHTFAVAATDTAGNTDPTPATANWTINTAPPSPPTGVAATAVSPSRVDVSWVASPEPDVTTYQVYREGVLLGTVPAPATTFSDRTVFGPALFNYTVRAVDTGGNASGDSDPAATTTLPTGPPTFGDGFETGDTSRWTTVNGLVVQGSQVYSGAFSARGTTTGALTFAQKTLPATTSELFYDVRFKPISLGTMANLVGFQTATGVKLLTVFVGSTRKLGYRNDKTAVTVNSSTLVSLGAWHELQARVFVNGGASEVEIWLDGVRVGDLARTESLGIAPIGRVQLSNDTTGKTFDVAFDQAAVASSYVVPGVPAAPFGVSATAGVASATVNWKPPYDGGSAITSYTVTSSPGGITATVGGSQLSAVVSGLTNGTAYTFTVTATNALGTGPASAPSNAVTPSNTVPGAPTGVTATAGIASAGVTWSPPASDGGSPITGYTVTASPGGATASVDGSTLSTTVTGLTNGTTYTFTVTATNAIGTGPPSAPSNAVTPATTPDAPTGVTATGDVASAHVGWSPPAFNGGSAITSYTVTSSPGGVTAIVNGSTLNATVTGLTNGTQYTFTVTATNVVGTGPASAPSNPVTPEATVPGAPTNVTATAGPGSATVTWQAPFDGGSPIIEYTVTSSPDGITATVNGSTLTANVAGLTNGTQYTFTVTATNSVGTGPASAPSNPVTPSVTAPGAPQNVTAAPHDSSATVNWQAPASDGGSPITSYTVTSSPGGITASVDGSTFSTTMIGLTNGTSYTFTVTATNAVGTGPASAPSNAVTPALLPGAPTGTAAIEGIDSAIVSWRAPASDGGSPITSYTVTSSPGGITAAVNGSTLSATVTGLTNGTAYTFTVTATNAIGAGPASGATSPITPYDTIPRSVMLSDSGFSPVSAFAKPGDSVTWSFTGPSNNHSVTDATGIGLYNTGLQPPGFSFSYTYTAAGVYTYVDQGSTSASGEVRVPIAVAPASGTSSTVFAIRWAAISPPAGRVFDVQIMKPGAGSFVNWRQGVTVVSGTFSSSDPAWTTTGTYSFRARLRSTVNGHSTGWSNSKTITVS
jgi:plastocyanin